MGREVRKVASDWEHPKRINQYSGNEEYHPQSPGEYLVSTLADYYSEMFEFDEVAEGCSFAEYRRILN